MKKTALIGLMTLSMAGVAQAATLDFTPPGSDYDWATAGNWTGGALPNDIPGAADDVTVKANTALTALQITTTTAEVASMAVGETNVADGHVAIGSTGELNLSGQLLLSAQGNSASFENAGTLNVGSIELYRGNLSVVNSGTIDSEGDISIGRRDTSTFSNTGDITLKRLLLGNQTSVTFGMDDGGTVEGTLLGAWQASNVDSGAQINLHGGTMTFDDVNIFDTGNASSGNYLMDVLGDGELIVEGQNMVTYFQDAIDEGWITGATGVQVTYDDINDLTIVAVPEPGTYALLAGCLALTSVMLRRRR